MIMEMLLAITVIVATIFFGALISVGNERQRKAIDSLREQVTLWAMQDLRIKREQLALNVRVDDPLRWLNKIAAKASGGNLHLQIIDVFDNPQVLRCADVNGNVKTLFTLLSPAEVYATKRARRNRLSKHADLNPLLSLPRHATAIECSILNNGILFDSELALVWNSLTGKSVDNASILWMYTVATI